MTTVQRSSAEPAGKLSSSIPKLTALSLLSLFLLLYPLNITPEFPDNTKCLMLPGLTLLGFLAAQRIGLHMTATSWRENVALPVLAGLSIGLPILAWDANSILAVGKSLLWYLPKAAAEELIYRLGAMSCLAFGMSVVVKERLPAAPLCLLAAAAAQIFNIYLNVPIATESLLYIAFRFLLPGIVWGWLYFRYGFLASLVGHLSTHVWLDPLVAMIR